MSFFSVSQSDSVLSRLWSLVRRLRGQVHELRGRIRGLEAELSEVRERLQRNSGNSSRPPSSDGYRMHTSFRFSLRAMLHPWWMEEKPFNP